MPIDICFWSKFDEEKMNMEIDKFNACEVGRIPRTCHMTYV